MLFVKLKLSWCARAGNRAGFVLQRRGKTRTREQAKVFPPMRPDLALRIDIRCYFRLVAAPVIVFAREFIQTLQFSLLFTIATLWTAPGSAPLG